MTEVWEVDMAWFKAEVTHDPANEQWFLFLEPWLPGLVSYI